ncbi:MAG: DUF3179 domain-containing protein [Bacillota bacterium]|nr:DUF3179 domain-containing protein [Bacillota bacterium]MDW7678282.1 DUF3179 domain-containing protein [Bacillota bacterium]
MNKRNRKKTAAVLAGLLIKIVVLIGLTGCGSPASDEVSDEVTAINANDSPTVNESQGSAENTLDEFFANIRSGGPPMDGIPPIETPVYLSMEEADALLADLDVVFVVESSEGVYLYPQSILVWHEIVNETFDGEKRSITYCPLTGSAIGYRGLLSAGETTYGTSGKLLNSNLVLYDRVTTSYIPQILGMAVSGPLKGERLEEFPVIWTRWHLAKAYYEEGKVLSTETGFIRDYRRDPYGSYRSGDDYYSNDRLMFPVMNTDDRLSPKEVVLANRIGETPFAVVKEALKTKGLMAFNVEEQSLAAIYDEYLDTGRVFLRKANDQHLDFQLDNGRIVDEQTQSVWNERGFATSGPLEGSQLDMINAYDVMWFGWFAFHPQTEVYE